MADSRCPGSTGPHLTLDPALVPGRTPGTLGRFDAGDPDMMALPGDTPGSLGIGDCGSPGINVRFWSPPLHFEGSAEFLAFEQRVLDHHVVRTERRKRRSAGVLEGDLLVVEGGIQMRKDAATQCKTLLERARADLAKQKADFLKMAKDAQAKAEKDARAKGEVVATKVESFGITSGYRSPDYDEALWRRYFRSKYYRANFSKLQGLSKFVVGARNWDAVEHQAAQLLVNFIRSRKAAPGFSNHSDGIAVDFFTREGGETHGAKTGLSDADLERHNQRWEKTWFYRWLQEHKAEYGMERIPSEAWHWEFRGKSSR